MVMVPKTNTHQHTHTQRELERERERIITLEKWFTGLRNSLRTNPPYLLSNKLAGGVHVIAQCRRLEVFKQFVYLNMCMPT